MKFNNKMTGVALCISLALAGCVSTDTKTEIREQTNGVQSSQKNAQGDTVNVVKTISCPSPVAKISIAEMKCKAATCAAKPQATGNLAVLLSLSDKTVKDFSTLGGSMTTMIASSIASTGCFTLLDRETMDEIKKEMELAGLKFTPDTSDFVLTGAITSFEYEENKTGFGSFLSGAGGLLSNKETTAKMGLDMRLIDVKSSAVAYTKTYESDASNDNYSVGLLGFGSAGLAGGSASFGGNVEVEKAVRAVINQSVFDLVEYAADGKYTIVTKEVD
jgi:curli biogenesis system outer membrane secretion channel CsgG